MVRHNQNQQIGDASFASLINLQEFEKTGKNQLSNIISAGAAISALCWYNGDNQNTIFKKAAVMMAGQFMGTSIVNMLNKSGKIEDANSNTAKVIEVLTASGFYSVVALKGLKLPNVQSKQYQEAIIASVSGVFGGPFLDTQLNTPK
jgi:hypothetical protein